MSTIHAIAVFVVGFSILVAAISVLYVLSLHEASGLINSSIANVALSMVIFSVISVRIAWPLIGCWTDLLLTAYESEDDE